MSENRVHQAIISHLKFRRVPGAVTIHINNTPRSARDGARLQKMGMLKGAPDLLHCLNGLTIFHEIKDQKGRLSPEQKQVHAALIAAGMRVIVTYGLDDALQQLTNLGLIR